MATNVPTIAVTAVDVPDPAFTTITGPVAFWVAVPDGVMVGYAV